MKNLGNLMKQAQEVQQRMSDMQEKLADLSVEGQAGGSLVRITLTGKHLLQKVHIDPSLLKPEDAEVVEDLLVAAYNDAKAKLETQIQDETQKIMGDLPLPPGMKLPF